MFNTRIEVVEGDGHKLLKILNESKPNLEHITKRTKPRIKERTHSTHKQTTVLKSHTNNNNKGQTHHYIHFI